jgi:hypothetical protein
MQQRRKTTDWDQLSALAQAITALGPNPQQAAKLVDAVLDAIGKTPRGWYQLSQAVSALAPRLDRDQAAKLVDAGLDAIGKTTAWNQLSALAPLINDESLMRVVRGLLAHLKHCAGPADTAKCVSALLTTARRSDDPTFVGTVFEGLKAPMAFGEATELALQALQESFPDSADELKDLWCAADWAERTFPNLDLAAPPRWLVEDRA